MLACCAALIVAFDLLILCLNALGYDLSVLNQPMNVRRHGQYVRTAGAGLKGFWLFAVNTTLLLAHALMLALALRVRRSPSRGRALVAGAYSLLPCNYSICCFPVSIWLLAATRAGSAPSSTQTGL